MECYLTEDLSDPTLSIRWAQHDSHSQLSEITINIVPVLTLFILHILLLLCHNTEHNLNTLSLAAGWSCHLAASQQKKIYSK